MEKNRIKKNVAIFINCTLIALKSKAHKNTKSDRIGLNFLLKCTEKNEEPFHWNEFSREMTTYTKKSNPNNQPNLTLLQIGWLHK